MTPPVFRDYLSALRPLACARPAQHKHHLHLQQVSICTFVLVKQVKLQLLPQPLTPPHLQQHHLEIGREMGQGGSSIPHITHGR